VHKYYAYALTSSVACILAVIYTLLQLNWEPPPAPGGELPPVQAPGDPGPGPR
jgi:hypothetical protein